MTDGTDEMRPLTADECHVLALANAESARGIVHTEAWDEEMAALQLRFDRAGYVTQPKRGRLRVRRS